MSISAIINQGIWKDWWSTSCECVYRCFHILMVCFYWLFNVITWSRRGGGRQAGRARWVPLHQHSQSGLDETFDPWPGVCWISEGSPLPEEAVVWRCSKLGQKVLQYVSVIGKCSGSSAGTWLLVHSGDVDLKSSDVAHQEGQAAPVEHLGGERRYMNPLSQPVEMDV